MVSPEACPQCGKHNVAEILYGLPAFTEELIKLLEQKAIVLGGCTVSDYSARWHCNECGHRWGAIASGE